MPVGPSDRVEAPPLDDPVMLAILANGGHRGGPLSPAEERLLDDWADGHLAANGPAVAAATGLVRRNALAAEHLLERRLLALAARAPEAPRIVAVAAHDPRVPPSPAVLPVRWPWRLLPWRWPALAGGMALASVLAVASVPLVREAMRGEAPLQLALVSIADRGALFEPTDLRMRGGERAPVPATERRFRDLELPVAALRMLFADAALPSPTAPVDIEALLPPGRRREPTRVLIDAALRARADAGPEDARLPVRLYDLDDPRAVDLRAALGVVPGAGGRLFLLTGRP